NGVNRVSGGAVKTYSEADGLPGNTIYSLSEDVLGRMWMGVGDSLAYFQNGRFKKIEAAGGTPVGPVFGITSDAQGAVWAASGERGLWRVRGDVAEPVPTRFTDLFRVLAARDGLLWAASFANG